MFEERVSEVLELSDTSVLERLETIEIRGRELDAEKALLVSVIDQRSLWSKVDGHRSMAALLRARLNCTTSEAATWRSLGRTVNQLDGVGDAWIQGRLGPFQVRQIAGARSNARVREHLGPFVPILVAQGEVLEAADFKKLVDETVSRLDPDGAHDDRDEAIEHRNAHVSNVGGSLAIDAHGGDPLTTAEMIKIFDRFVDAEYDKDVAARVASYGDAASEHDLARTDAQRRFDATIAILRSANAAADEGLEGQPAALVLNIVCDSVTYAAMSHAAGLATEVNVDGERVDPFTGLARPGDLLEELMFDPAGLLDRRCETDTGVPVHPHDLLRAALSGHVRRVVVDAAGTVIDHGRKARLFTGPARDAAKLLIHRCEHPGCRLPATFCQVDHAEEWSADDGGTDQVNGRIRCGPHNRDKFKQRWRSKRAKNGKSYTIRSDGTIMLPAGARPPDLDFDVEFSDLEVEVDEAEIDDVTWARLVSRIDVDEVEYTVQDEHLGELIHRR